MNKYKLTGLWLTTALTTFTLWGCGETPEETPGGADAHDTPLVIGSALLAPTEDTQTRAANQALDVDGTAIGIFCYSPENGYNSKKLCKYTCQSKKWAPADAGQAVWLGGKQTYLYSVYPWENNNTDPEKMELTAHPVKDDAEASASYACVRQQAVNKSTPNVTLTYKRQYAKVIIKFRAGPSNMKEIPVSDFTLLNICHKATHDLLTGTYETVDTGTPLYISKEMTLTTIAQEYAILLVPPLGAGEYPAYRLTAGGKTLSGQLSSYFAAGKEYTLVITVKNKGAEVETVTTEQWTTENIDLDGNL